MLSLFGILLLGLSTTPASARPLRRWQNTTSSVLVDSSSVSAPLPLNVTVNIANAATDVPQSTASDDCEDTSSVSGANPTWPAALSTVQTNMDVAGGSYSSTLLPAAPRETYAIGQTSRDGAKKSTAEGAEHHSVGGRPAEYTSMKAISKPFTYGDWTSYYTDFEPVTLTSGIPGSASTGVALPSVVTSLGKHANATASAARGSYGAGKPHSSFSEDTTTLTLYTTVGSEASATPSVSSAAVPTTDHGINTYQGQTTSTSAYINQLGSSSSHSETRNPRPGSSSDAYSSQTASAYLSAAPSSDASSTSRTRRRPTRTGHTESSFSPSQPTGYTTADTRPASSSSVAYPTPQTTSSDSIPASTVTVNPVPTSYIPPSQAYSYSPQASTSLPSADPPIMPTSQAYSDSPQPSAGSPPQSPSDSYATDTPAAPTIASHAPSSLATTTTTTSTSSTSMAGITIVPVDPDATTVYITVTTTKAGMTTTVAGPTVTDYA